MDPVYDNIGINYSVMRRTDPVIARQLYREIDGASRIVNIGAGTGSYEPAHVELVAARLPAAFIEPALDGWGQGRGHGPSLDD